MSYEETQESYAKFARLIPPLLDSIRRSIRFVSSPPTWSGGLSWSVTVYVLDKSSEVTITIDGEDDDGMFRPFCEVLIDTRTKPGGEPHVRRLFHVGERATPVAIDDHAAVDDRWKAFKKNVQPKSIAKIVETALKSPSSKTR